MTSTKKNTQFKKGASGNPAGRPRGSRNLAMLECEQLLHAAAPHLTRVLIEKAKKGDMQAMRLCVDRTDPAPKEQALQLKLPPVASAKDLPAACLALTSAMAEGQISAAEGESVLHMLTSFTHTRQNEHGAETSRWFAETANVARGDSDFSERRNAQPRGQWKPL
jgi:hypothetical protein